MSTQPQTEEYLAARRESCRLLGLNADDLTPHEMIRADLATVLRLWLDGSQSALLAGGNADPVKLLSVVEALTKLVPETEHKSRGESPQRYMLRTYLEMRRRGDLAGDENNFDFQRRRRFELEAEVERLRAEIAALKAGAENSAPDVSAPGASGGTNVTPGGNVVKLLPRGDNPGPPATAPDGAVSPSPPAAPPKPAPQPQAALWKDYVNSDGSIRSTPRGVGSFSGKDWGPVG